MREIIGLARVQHIDRQLDQFEARLQSIRIQLTNDKELKTIKANLNNLENKYQKTKLKMNSSEQELHENIKKIEESEASLYSGNIKNPKELQEVQIEIASLSKLRSKQEDKLILEMMEIEEITNEIENASNDYQNVEIKLQQQNQDLLKERNEIYNNLEILKSERKVVIDSISDEAISLYSKLRISKKGVAISFVTDGVCGSCGSTLTPTQIQSVKTSNSLIPCATCGRLLFSQ